MQMARLKDNSIMGVSDGIFCCYCLCFISEGETYKIPKDHDILFFPLKMQEEKLGSRLKTQMTWML